MDEAGRPLYGDVFATQVAQAAYEVRTVTHSLNRPACNLISCFFFFLEISCSIFFLLFTDLQDKQVDVNVDKTLWGQLADDEVGSSSSEEEEEEAEGDDQDADAEGTETPSGMTCVPAVSCPLVVSIGRVH